MSRDDSSGGWVPMGGGGLSNVSVRKRPRPSAPPAATSTVAGGQQPPPAADPNAKPKHDYLIYGKRISDNSTILSCTIKKDFEYNKVMPTFHHWKTGDKKFGLTFKTAADARAFDKGVRTAVEDLLDGFAETSPSCYPLPKCPKDVGDEDVFMTLNLPQEPKDSRSSSDSSTKGTDHFHRIHYIGREKALEPRPPTYDTTKAENYSYVQLTAVHEYTYPSEEQQKPTVMRRDSNSPIKKGIAIEMAPAQPPLPLPLKQKKTTQVRCKHCNEPFSKEHNPRGSCEYAPDVVRSTINAVTCIGCAQCMSYHCAADAEGDFVQHPCSCARDDNCTRRWLSLTFLSIFIPCLWCYPPLALCHFCGVKCGMCGGKHSM